MTSIVRTRTVVLFLSLEYLVLGWVMQFVSLNFDVNLFNIGVDRPWSTFVFFMLLSLVVVALAALFGKKIERTLAPVETHLETTKSYATIVIKRLPYRVLVAAISVLLIGSIGAGIFVGTAIIGIIGFVRTKLWERTHDSIVVQLNKRSATQGEFYIHKSPDQ